MDKLIDLLISKNIDKEAYNRKFEQLQARRQEISIRILPIFGKEIIQLFKDKGFIWNLHTGLLPKYKGVHIPYRAIENNESHYGWTLHRINQGEISLFDVKELYDAAYTEKEKTHVNLKRFQKLMAKATLMDMAYRAQLATAQPFQYGMLAIT